MTEGAGTSTERQASASEPSTTGAAASTKPSSRPQHAGPPSAVRGSPPTGRGRPEAQVLAKKRTLYERLTHDMQHDHKFNQEVRMGKRVGFYKLKGQLGAGNFAKVKLGVHLLTTGKHPIIVVMNLSTKAFLHASPLIDLY